MKSLLSKVKMEALSLDEMAQVTGGDTCWECTVKTVITYFSSNREPEEDVDSVDCVPCA